MNKLSAEEVARRKKAVFDSMSDRRQKHILRKGYDRWDPFEEPKDPIDIRKDKTNRTTQMLVREFLQASRARPRTMRITEAFWRSHWASSTMRTGFEVCSSFPAGIRKSSNRKPPVTIQLDPCQVKTWVGPAD